MNSQDALEEVQGEIEDIKDGPLFYALNSLYGAINSKDIYSCLTSLKLALESTKELAKQLESKIQELSLP